MQSEITGVETVLAACVQAYAARRITVEKMDTVELREGRIPGGRLNGVVARAQNRIEVAIPHEADLSLYPAMFDGFSRAGWDVWALVPTELLGPAHRHLRGIDVTLQPWWESGSGVLFGRPELP
ncbi:MAG: hypothetical protein ACXWH0_09350 [Acidimicrobiia bacterium]